MPTYVFRCATGCEDFSQRHPIASPPDGVDCPKCAAWARRLVGRPGINSADRTAMRLHNVTRATADAPDVVDRLPHRRRAAAVTTDPRHRRLPRP